jgi:hypothetical protein
MPRHIEPELLDTLPATDPRALRSRRDLVRINTCMGNAARLVRVLTNLFPVSAPRRLVELGAGDGELMLRVARRLNGRWPGVELILVDQHPLLTSGMREQFARVGWSACQETADAFDWLQRFALNSAPADAILANLFLHHFPETQLCQLFRCAASVARRFIAIEPRRSRTALWFSRMVWMIGCGPVTQHDAPASVRAGFRDDELSRLWPGSGDWQLIEKRAGSFAHVFSAQRVP